MPGDPPIELLHVAALVFESGLREHATEMSLLAALLLLLVAAGSLANFEPLGRTS